MSNNTPQTSSWAGKYSTRRSVLHDAIIDLSVDPRLRTIGLIRALAHLQLPELEELYDELFDLAGEAPGRPVSQKTTLRDEKQ